MKKAYSKGISIISSCKNSEQLLVAKKYIENFDIMYSKSMLSQKLVILHNLLKLQFRKYE